MQGIEWVAEYTLGIEEIDKQHRELVAITDRLFKAIMDERGEAVLLEILHAIAEYAAYHFDYEEKLLREYEYPLEELEEHVKEHDDLKKQVADFTEAYAKAPAAMDLSLFGFLRSWTDEHMQRSDSLYVDFLKDKGVK